MGYEVFRQNGQRVLVNVQELQKKPEETLEIIIRDYPTYKRCLQKINELSQYSDSAAERSKYEAALQELISNHPEIYKSFMAKAREELHNQ